MKKFLKILSLVFVTFGMVLLGNNCFAEDEIELPELYFKAINPGYVVDGVNNVGEMIEISRKESDAPISLAGVTVGYTNSSGNTSTLFEFPENSWLSGESILLRLASSPEGELAAINYNKTLAFKAELKLLRDDVLIDSVCWTGKDGCVREFKSSAPTFLVRNLTTQEFEHMSEYEIVYDPDAYYVEKVEEESAELPSQCKGLIFSEILSYYETLKTEQFIELYNSSSEQILMDGCKIRYKNKTYSLSGVIGAEGYYRYLPVDFSLTKNPTNSNELELIDVNGERIDKLVYLNGQRKGASYALIGYDEAGKAIWRVTFAPTPGEANNYQEFRSCEDGKVINEATGNCVKVVSIVEKVCPEGQYLNLLTGRCNKIKMTEEKKCKEGYYLNPDTGRCRKIYENNGADYHLEPENYEEESSFTALYAVLGVIAVGLVYLVYEFRREILKLFRKVFRRFH